MVEDSSPLRGPVSSASPPASRSELVRLAHHVRRLGELSAEILRDPKRTGRWEGAEKTARQFDRVASLGGQIEALANTPGWRDISTAPRDGTVLLLAAHDIHGMNDQGGPRSMIRTAYWHDELRNGQGDWSGGRFTTHFPPTHWMPLPQPPEVK